MKLRRMAVMTAALTMALSGIGTVLVVGSAGAKVVGTGTYNCAGTHMNGEASFNPAWSDTGTGKSTASIDLVIADCSGGSPNVPQVETRSGSFTFNNGASTCGSGGMGRGKITFVYGAGGSHGLQPTKVKSSQFAVAANGSGFSVSAPASGSYTSASASISVLATPTGNCSSGITKMTATSIDVTDL